MTLLSHNALTILADICVIGGVQPGAINAASIDIHLGSRIMIERVPDLHYHTVDYGKRERPLMDEIDITGLEFVLEPGAFILAQSVEVFNLPDNISAEYKLKSSMARIGLEHLNAGWCDAGWHGSVLTLELKNMTRYHTIRLRPGDAIGQMVFFEHAPVPVGASYATRGRYNNDIAVSGIKL